MFQLIMRRPMFVFNSWFSSCKAGLLLFPLKCAGCMLDLILEGSQWVTHGTPNPRSVCVHLPAVWESFHMSYKQLHRKTKGVGCRCPTMQTPKPESNQARVNFEKHTTP